MDRLYMAFKQDQIFIWQKESSGSGDISKNNEKKMLLEKKINIIQKGIDYQNEKKNDKSDKSENFDENYNISKLCIMKIYLSELLMGSSEEILILIKNAVQVFVCNI